MRRLLERRPPGSRRDLLRSRPGTPAANAFEAGPRAAAGRSPKTKRCLIVQMTLEQACPKECQRAQCAFKDSMIHGILQFTLLFAFRCVLHRCWNQEIRC